MKKSILEIKKSRWIKVAFALICFAAFWYWRVQILGMISIIGDRDAIVNYLQPYGILGPLVLFLILMLQVFLALIPGHAFIIAGGYIYGFYLGAIITLTSTVIASQLAFLLVRQFGRPFVDRMAPAQVVDHWNQLAQKQGVWFFFFGFILPFFPNDLMAFIAGLCAISARKFFVANFFGRLIVAIFITLIGSHGFEVPIYFWMLMILIVLGLSISWKYYAPVIEKRFFNKISSNKYSS